MSVLEGSRLTDHDFKNMDKQIKLTTSKKSHYEKLLICDTIHITHVITHKILGNYILGRLRNYMIQIKNSTEFNYVFFVKFIFYGFLHNLLIFVSKQETSRIVALLIISFWGQRRIMENFSDNDIQRIYMLLE